MATEQQVTSRGRLSITCMDKEIAMADETHDSHNSNVKLLSSHRVAEMLDVSVATVMRLTAMGVLPAPVHIGRAVRWPEAGVLAYIRRLSMAQSAQSRQQVPQAPDTDQDFE
jgi:predicted DNA-binding transcriptional regulator AlpA